MTDLTTLTTPSRIAHDVFEADVPDGWQQGRGAFGGLVLGNLVRAITMFDQDDAPSPPRRLRALTAELCAPVLPGKNRIHVERLRTGTGVATIAARLSAGGEVLAHAVGVLGKDRPSDADCRELPAPMPPPWRDVPVVPLAPPFGPTFVPNFELRPLGALPFSGAAESHVAGWVRPKDAGPARDAAYVTALADVWWPAFFTRFPTPRPMATIAFTIDLLDGVEGLDPDAPLFHTARGLVARNGYVVELRELWGEDGRLVALNHQTIAIIK
jgi:acyl-CoA thioesterase